MSALPLFSSQSPGVTEFPLRPALLTAAEVARVLAVSIRSLRRLASSGKLPLALRLGRSTRWRQEEILAWIAAGCPSRSAWHWQESRPAEKRRLS